MLVLVALSSAARRPLWPPSTGFFEVLDMAYRVMDFERYGKLMDSTPADCLDDVVGFSPGFVAARLGITRQGVHNAIVRGRMKAFKLVRNSQVKAIIIPAAEIERYRLEVQQKKAG